MVNPLPLAADGFAIMVIGLVEITVDAIAFVAVHFSTLLNGVAAAKGFDR